VGGGGGGGGGGGETAAAAAAAGGGEGGAARRSSRFHKKVEDDHDEAPPPPQPNTITHLSGSGFNVLRIVDYPNDENIPPASVPVWEVEVLENEFLAFVGKKGERAEQGEMRTC